MNLTEEIIMMKYQYGLTVTQIANELEITEESILKLGEF